MNDLSPGAVDRSDPSQDSAEFSLVPGGLLFRFLRWARLADDSLLRVRPRIIVIASFAWVPLLLLSAAEGTVLDGSAAVPFLLDVQTHVRLLVALPLLIFAEVETHRRIPPLLRQFARLKLVPESEMPRYRAALASASRWRSSTLAEVVLLAAVYGVGIMFVWRHLMALDTTTWYATPTGEGSKLTLAGMWYGYVSLPIVQFLLLRWYWRLIVWARLLWQLSRIRLSLVPTHPDRAAGLGFLAIAGYAFTMLAMAHGALAAAQMASRIFYAGAALSDFFNAVCVLVILVLGLVLGPLLFFAPQLRAAKQVGVLEYGALAERYVREFDDKWLRGAAPPDETLVGSADIQSMADLGGSLDVVQTMRIAPFTTRAMFQLAAATTAPIAPLLLTVIPLNELLKQLFGVAF
jgi:hypothetical protein